MSTHVSQEPSARDDDRFACNIVAGYLILQAIATATWWLCLLTIPASIKLFQPLEWPQSALLSFWLPDLMIIVVGSVVAAWATFTRQPWTQLSLWSIAAASWYATLNCIACSIMTGQAWLAAAAMTCMSGLCLAMSTIYGLPGQQPATFRTTPLPKKAAVIWSLLQLIIFWSVFLWILPMGILEVQRQFLHVEPFEHSWQFVLSLVLFCTASAVGASSCLVMAWDGEGTPLPTANPPKLVTAGPYGYVRNPMALAGITQGVAIGWMLGSWLVIAYALCGAVVWHVCVRPVEEKEMHTRLGEVYARYQRSVPLWCPRLRSKE